MAFIVSTIALFSTIVVFTPLAMVFASTNVIEDFEGGGGETNQSSLDNQAAENEQSDASQDPSESESKGSDQFDNQSGQNENKMTDSNESNTSHIGSINIQDPSPYYYKINIAKNPIIVFGDGSTGHIQYIRTNVMDLFGQGIANLVVEVKVRNPLGSESTFSSTTDSNGYSQIFVNSYDSGVWRAVVTINSDPSVGGPYTENVSWKSCLSKPECKTLPSPSLPRNHIDIQQGTILPSR